MQRYKEYQETGWVVSIERPEEIYKKPHLYYTAEEIRKYVLSGAMQRAQEKIAYRILELLDLKKGKLLDLGCGPGFTTLVYQDEGYDVIGLDVMPKMLEAAKSRGVKVIEGDMQDIKKLFKNKKFDAVVSASALQWVIKENELKEIAEGVYDVLKKDGKIAIQFYPKSEEQLMKTAHIFKEAGFEGQIIIDNAEIPKKRVIYLIMKKSKS